jgi:hypothetical protein
VKKGKKMKGINGKILWVDLTAGKLTVLTFSDP